MKRLTDILTCKYEDPLWVVPGILTEGLSILAGKPKTGKSYAAANIAVSVATGGIAFGKIQCPRHPVLYLALEDSERRLQTRFRQLVVDGDHTDDLWIATAWPRQDMDGTFPGLEKALDETKARLLIVDTLQKIKRAQKPWMNAYEEDYEAFQGLHRISLDRGVATLVLTHRRKAQADDVMDSIMGSTGITGVADTIMVLDRGRGDKEGKLVMTGREIKDTIYRMAFEESRGTWVMLGEENKVAMSELQDRVLASIEANGAPMSYKELSRILGPQKGALMASLKELAMKRLLVVNAKPGETTTYELWRRN